MSRIPGHYHYDAVNERHHYNSSVTGDEWCPECNGDTIWNDTSEDYAHCLDCGACSDPDHSRLVR